MRDATLRLILIAIAAFNAADYFLTLSAISKGATEANPVMDAILHTPLFPVVKLLLVPLALLFVWHVRGRIRPFFRYALLVPFLAYGLLTVWHAYIQVLIATL